MLRLQDLAGLVEDRVEVEVSPSPLLRFALLAFLLAYVLYFT